MASLLTVLVYHCVYCVSKGWVSLSANFRRKGRRPTTTVGVRKYPQCIVWFCHKARVWRTDRQNYDS